MTEDHRGPVPGASELEARPLGAETPEIAEKATTAGTTRLARPLGSEALTAFIGGMSVSFGGVAMVIGNALGREIDGPALGFLLGALFFPVGFVILLIGKSELFTENFLLPVLGVLERRARVRSLLRVWSVALAMNLLGAALFALLVGLDGVVDVAARGVMIELAREKLEMRWWEGFVRALFAGWLMTVLTWLLLACDTVLERLAIIWTIATVLILGDFNHVVIGSAEVFMAWSFGLPPTPGRFLTASLVPATLGNLVGGLVFVTALTYLQARGLKSGHARRRVRRRLEAARHRSARLPS